MHTQKILCAHMTREFLLQTSVIQHGYIVVIAHVTMIMDPVQIMQN